MTAPSEVRQQTLNTPAAAARAWVQPELYRIRDAASMLAVSPRMIYTFIASGVLVPVYLPSSGTRRQPVRIARADLVAFVARLRGGTA
jgi:helix-turn-helix protein